MANHWSLLILLILSIYFVANIHTCLSAPNISAVCSKQERLALLKFKHSVKDAADMLSSWVGNDCCQWERVHCDKVTGKVESLHLRSSEDIYGDQEGLVGNKVNSSLRHLRNLKFLDLSANDFQGSRIPEFIGSFKQLSYLNLSNANFSGVIPPHIGNLSNLKVLDLRSSKYTYSVLMSDDMSWISGLSLLKYLDLSNVDLSQAQNRDMVFYMMPSLVKLSLSGCSLTNADLGTLSNSSTTLANIKHLDLGGNHFTGELPRELGNLRELLILDLGDNEFSGKIPEWIGENLKELARFRLHKNNFTGSIPRSLCHNSNLQILDVAHNNLMGPIPHCLGSLNGMINHSSFAADSRFPMSEENLNQVMKGVSLEYTTTFKYVINMDISSNNLVGEIPVELMSLSALLGLNLSNNHLNGGIPASIGNMKALISLDFSGNQLTGPIPPSIAALNFLSHLNLSHNNLSGQIPTGNQLQTLTDPSIYFGNRDLCGAPLQKNCSNNEDQAAMHKNHKAANHISNKVWFYMDIVCGFAAGFWGVIGLLLLKKDWRHKLFRFAEENVDKIYVAVVLRVDKMKSRR